jgi:hypothetical protein
MKNGWVSIYRQIFNNNDLKDNNHILIFIYLIVHASHKPVSVTYRRKRIVLKRGQVAVSVKDLSNRFKLTTQNVRTILKNLELTNCLTHYLHKQLSVFTIVNYNKFQDSDITEVRHNNKQTNKQNNTTNYILYSSKNNDKSLSNMTKKPKPVLSKFKSLQSKIVEPVKVKNEWEIAKERLDAQDYEKWVLRKLNS